ncbi:hypothetical protein ACK2FW_23075 [Clostridioides difficile]
MKNVRRQLEEIAFGYESNNSKSKNNNNQLKNKIKKQINKLQDLYFDDLIDKEDYKLKYQKLNTQLIKLEKIIVKKKIYNKFKKYKKFFRN